MSNHLNPHGASASELKEQELFNSLLMAEFALSDSKTLEDKKKALDMMNLVMSEIEKDKKDKENKKPNLYFDVDSSLIPTMMAEMEARIMSDERFQNWQNPEWMDRQLDELSNLKEIGYSKSESAKYIEPKYYSKLNWCHPHDDVQWDNQSWEEQKG